MKENRATTNEPSPVCAGCGYPTRGIAELKCPECGADLRIVGTVMPGSTGKVVFGCLLPLGFTILTAILSFALYVFLSDQVLPSYNDYNITMQFEPESKRYREVKFWVDATSTTNAGMGASQGSLSSSTNHATTPSTTSLTLFNTGTQLDVYSINIVFSPDPSSPASVTDWAMYVAPDTRQASWVDAKTRAKQTTPGPFTPQDILAQLASLDVDITDPNVVSEANELHKLADGLMNGQTQFTLQGLNAWSVGHGMSSRPGPTWVLVTYWITWAVIYLIGLILLMRIAKRRAFGGPKQKHKKY